MVQSKQIVALSAELAAGSGENIDPSSYVYKKCKGKLHRLDTLKRQTRQLQESIKALPINIPVYSPETGAQDKHTHVTPPQLPGSSIQGTPRSRKRALEESEPKSHKRQRLYLRQIESHPTNANNSTAVYLQHTKLLLF